MFSVVKRHISFKGEGAFHPGAKGDWTSYREMLQGRARDIKFTCLTERNFSATFLWLESLESCKRLQTRINCLY